MEVIKYKSDKRFAILFGVVPLLVLYVFLIIKTYNHPQFFEGISVITFCYVFFILSITIGSFGILDENKKTFSKVNYLLFKKNLARKDIQEIWYQSTWVMGGLGKSLYVRGVSNGNFCVLDFPNVGFAEKTLAQIVHDLKEMNPNISLDKGAQNLLESVMQE